MSAVPILKLVLVSAGVSLLVAVAPADAQAIAGISTYQADSTVREGNRWLMKGQVEITVRADLRLLAEEVDYSTETKVLTAIGNVVFAGTSQQIAADRIVYNIETQTGTFHNAEGMMSLGTTAELALFGSADAAVFFRGETIEKIGSDRYRITNGAFTTCLQPTPRWELVAGTVVLHRDRYALLKGTVFKVKNVPVLYLPFLYYPINDENRSTGFLIPQYGVSTVRGQTIGNAFFWAIDRSQDATFLYDWFSRTGQGLGGEYRYMLGPSSGNAQVYLLNEHPTTLTDPAGQTSEVPGRRSYQIVGSGTHTLGGGLRASGRVDYFSDITVQQTYHTDIYDASQRSRSFTGALTKSWTGNTLSGSYDRSETFFGTTDSTLTGTGPRISFSRGERPIGESRVYVSVAAEYARMLREGRSGTTTSEAGLDRLDVLPVVRFPFTRWPFLTVNSTVRWRNTFWSESRDAEGRQIETGISRRYFDLQAQVTGPVFNKIWDTPGSGYAERFKHSIEPVFTVRRATAIDQFDRIVQLEAVDSIVGATTQYTYGLNNRLFAKRQEGGSSVPASREILTVSVNQSYYTDANAAKYDQYYRSSFSGTPPSHFSPVSIQARVAPTLQTLGTFRAEYDAQFRAFRSIGADATVWRGGWLQTTAGWSQRRFIEGLAGFDDPGNLDHYLNQTTQLSWPTGRLKGVYSLNYDIRLQSLLQQRLLVFYNAQCCGISFEYQTFDFSRLGSRAPVPKDRRVNFSFTLAGLGSFSNFFGAMGGV